MERETLGGLVKYSQTSCYLCSEWLDDSVVEEHLLHCRQQTIVCSNHCGVSIARKYLPLHLNTCRAIFGGSEKMDDNANALNNTEAMDGKDGQLTCIDMIEAIEANVRSLKLAIADIKFNFDRLYQRQDSITYTCNSTNRMGTRIYDIVIDHKKHQEFQRKKLNEELDTMKMHIAMLEQRICKMKGNNPNTSNVQNATVDQLSVLQERIESLEFQNYWYRNQLTSTKQHAELLQKRVAEINCRGGLASTTGRVIWRITNFAELMAESKQQYTILQGPIFTNVPYGYKLQLIANLNGRGNLQGPNMTVSLVVFSGPYDNLLQWPCRLSASIKLRGQTGSGSEPPAADFYRPIVVKKAKQLDRCEEFMEIPHAVLLSSSYLQNDTIFLEVTVRSDNST